jgi:hypothetical protein
MKWMHQVLMGAVACAAASVAAAGPPIDPPTPPPCCVDGVCRAHATTFGYFPTRWRVWPGIGVAPEPTIQEPQVRKVPGVEPYDLPPPEEEDRRAPEPTRSPDRPAAGTPAGEAADGAQPVTTPLEQLGPRPGATERTPPIGVPPVTTPQGGFPPFSPQQGVPQGTPPGAMPPSDVPSTFPTPDTVPFNTQPFGDLDRPPAPPFASTAPSVTSSSRRNVQAGASERARPVVMSRRLNAGASQVSQASMPAANLTSGDPPPPPPFALNGPAL